MKTELMKMIFNHIIENLTESQIINSTADKFRSYIYDDKGAYLIGGKEVHDFICDSVKLISKY